ncbi:MULTISPECIES: phosphoglycerate dehydrogenase [Bordetella]|uniref:D-3-phosphoglycerate dehydrogenase n=1 Tax=Bordetella genomosp. 6 TaxID=463024 RepID=A0ABX4FH63_9BORD|nr:MULTISPECIES: phosphoglycerate dehydrogenase [Bordetella]AOB28575.1 D-3-phosphoglycerate dehydrogenase [Bordetella bronchiseptica]AZW45924.1 phosphoglycerate dehydrogenase [Bordetella bronchiseptica]KDD20844.1 phosphoglycerate dehydrogenase [Bordetella bronchiseptica MBORD782]OZI80592.1 D-3-phosphoglycerate dehydrogenase [Bordetella genomosp. 6]VTQ72054.1 D-3-phosphoglycerate dehydrogenase [Bordetella bronchiseptica]
MAQIVLFENIHPSARAVFSAAGYTDIAAHAAALPPGELREALRGAEVVGIRSRTHLDADLLAANPDLRVVGCFCIGTNQVDLDAAMMRGVPVFNAPFSNTRSVAELVLGEAILLLRRIPEKNARVHLGHWDKSAAGAYEARGKTLGIVGYGNIGSQISTLAEAIGMRVVFFDVEAKLPLGNARAAASLVELLEQADVVTLHVPGGKSTQNIINADTLARMKRGAILINASRGTVVDIQALHGALASGHLAGAALDVFPTEPKSADEPLASPLIGMPNVLLTPHIGGSTQESQENIGREVAEKLVRFLQAGTTKSAVNFPELSYQAPVGGSRIIHVHRNAPGALGALDNLMAQHGLNIVSQSLQTKGQIGYAVTDVDGDVTDTVLADLRSHPVTVRCEKL